MKNSSHINLTINRRRFCKLGMQAALFNLFPVSAIASIDRLLSAKRDLFLFNTHTGQKLDVCYYEKGRYHPEALKKINYILRDHRTEEIKPMDAGLLNLLHSISTTFDQPIRFHIISGYRSPETNGELREKSRGVAKNSLHMKGKAADIRIPGYDTRWLRDICMNLKSGGVGYYRKSDFVHVDTGLVRYW
jgi:uncharacterized protein YcbK (DUF882 family)